MDGMLEQVRVCEGVLAEEKQQHANTRQEVAKLGQELEMAGEDLVKERTRHREDVEVLLDFTGPIACWFCWGQWHYWPPQTNQNVRVRVSEPGLPLTLVGTK